MEVKLYPFVVSQDIEKVPISVGHHNPLAIMTSKEGVLTLCLVLLLPILPILIIIQLIPFIKIQTIVLLFVKMMSAMIVFLMVRIITYSMYLHGLIVII